MFSDVKQWVQAFECCQVDSESVLVYAWVGRKHVLWIVGSRAGHQGVAADSSMFILVPFTFNIIQRLKNPQMSTLPSLWTSTNLESPNQRKNTTQKCTVSSRAPRRVATIWNRRWSPFVAWLIAWLLASVPAAPAPSTGLSGNSPRSQPAGWIPTVPPPQWTPPGILRIPPLYQNPLHSSSVGRQVPARLPEVAGIRRLLGRMAVCTLVWSVDHVSGPRTGPITAGL